MNRQRASIFPGHKYDFGDSVFALSTGWGGRVDGIWHNSENQTWNYHLSNQPKLANHANHWWLEDELEPACPNCFAPWDEASLCDRCGQSPNDSM
jgi:hypothetical protein